MSDGDLADKGIAKVYAWCGAFKAACPFTFYCAYLRKKKFAEQYGTQTTFAELVAIAVKVQGTLMMALLSR